MFLLFLYNKRKHIIYNKLSNYNYNYYKYIRKLSRLKNTKVNKQKCIAKKMK